MMLQAIMEVTTTVKVLITLLGLLWSAVAGLGGYAMGAASDHSHEEITRMEVQVVEVNRRLGEIEGQLNRLIESR